mgnify:CR=1 FL=1
MVKEVELTQAEAARFAKALGWDVEYVNHVNRLYVRFAKGVVKSHFGDSLHWPTLAVEFAEQLANVRDIISYASKGLIPGEKVQVPYLSPSAIREAFGVNEPDAPMIFRYEVVTHTPERYVLGIETNLEENMTTITRLDRRWLTEVGP